LSFIVTSFVVMLFTSLLFFFFFHDSAPTDFYTLSLHDALPILFCFRYFNNKALICFFVFDLRFIFKKNDLFYFRIQTLKFNFFLDRKSTRLNSSHVKISYAVFCLKKKKESQ